MKFKNAARIFLLVAAVALISLKVYILITTETTLWNPAPAGYGSPTSAAAPAQGLSPHGDGPMEHTLSSLAATTSECVPCNQAAAEETCPPGCECLTEAQAAELGLALCNNEQIDCWVSSGQAAAPVPGYCYQTTEEAACPDYCLCLPVTDAQAAGYRLCDGVEIECAVDTRVKHMCYHVKCPDGCVCVTEATAKARGYPGLCDGAKTLCGYDAHGNPEYCYTETTGPVVCRDSDIDLRQLHLESGQIRFIADISCPVTRVEMIIGGTKVKECAGRYCEYTGGPYPPRAAPDFSAILFDHLDQQVGTPAFTPHEIVATMPDVMVPGDFDFCPHCPEPQPEWGECLSHTCDGNDHFQAYDWTSHVQLTGCFYENYSLTGGLPIYLGEGLLVETQVAEPVFDYCINDTDIVLHRCRNNFISQYTHTCPYGCYNGMCLCATSDGGINFYERGGVLYGINAYVPGAVDYCIDENTLREYYTELDLENNTCTIKWIDFECPGICRDGACHGTCFDGIQNEGELGIDCGGPCLAACEYDVGWYAQNYGFKFENPPGQSLSYGSCWSRSSRCTTGYGHYKGTFGNCEVCICHCFGCCCGWHIHAGVYYPIYRWGGASQGQCTGVSLSSLAFYYGDRHVHEYDPLASEVIHLDYTGNLKDHIASRQGKVLSKENITHYLLFSDYWGAKDVLSKVESALSKDPPDYGMIFVIEDNGWGGLGNTVRRKPLGHTVVATNVVYADSNTARIYIYDPNVPVAESPTPDSPYFNIDRSPYIEIHKPSNTYTFYGPDPDYPIRDSDGQLWSNANDELFDRIGYMPYSTLAGDVDIPMLWDAIIIGIAGALGSADAQVEDGQGRILGFSEDGPDAPTIGNALILPVFGEPHPEAPTVFALPMGDYKLNIRGTGSGSYSAYILGDSPHAFAITDAEVSEGTRDTISLQFGAQGQATLSFSTSDAAKQYSLDIASLGEDNGDVTETLYSVMNATISSGSAATFSVDPVSHSLLYSNYGNTPVTYSVQIYRAMIPAEGMTQGMMQPMASYQAEAGQNCTGGCTRAPTATGTGANGLSADSGNDTPGDLGAIIDHIQVTDVYTFTIEPMERHIVSPEDWSNLPASELVVKRESVAASNWPLIGGIIGAVVVIAIAAFFLTRRRRRGAPQAGE